MRQRQRERRERGPDGERVPDVVRPRRQTGQTLAITDVDEQERGDPINLLELGMLVTVLSESAQDDLLPELRARLVDAGCG